MDPDQAYRDFCRALLEEDAETARELHEGLRRWMAGGGFEPAWTKAQRRQFHTFDPAAGRLS